MPFQAQIDNDGRGKVSYQIVHSQDVSGALRNAELHRRKEERILNPRSEIRPQVSLPMVIVMDIRKKYGLDVFRLKRGDEENRFWQIVESEYPKFRTTSKRVYRPKRAAKRISGAIIPPECLRPDV